MPSVAAEIVGGARARRDRELALRAELSALAAAIADDADVDRFDGDERHALGYICSASQATVSYLSCPTDEVCAPIDVVWGLLTDPADWGTVFDVRILGVHPPGRAAVGQRISAESGPRLLQLRVSFVYTLVDPARHRVCLDVHMPFGIVVHEDLDCIALGEQRCRVNYHCKFELARGWRGILTRRLLRSELDTGPADSLARLKRAAEARARRDGGYVASSSETSAGGSSWRKT
jgi:hypothetical protein